MAAEAGKFREENMLMKRRLCVLAIAAAAVMSANAMAWDVTSAATKVQKAADDASAKIDQAKLKNNAKSEKYKTQLEEKIKDLKAKIEKWQSDGDAKSSEKQEAIANAQASIERLNAKLKALSE